jgi:N-acetylglucosamine-6-sulfatase
MAIAKLFCIFLYLILITIPLSSPLPNFLFIITDDQDDIDSYTVMPSIRNDIVGKGAKLSNSFVTSPICCPSRTSLFSGRFPHNLDDDEDGWCGNYSSAMEDTWLHSLKLFPTKPYTIGQFGKYWNGGEGTSGIFCSKNYTPAWFTISDGDDLLLLCEEGVYFGNLYNDRGIDVKANETDYMTSVLSNRTLQFLEKVSSDLTKPWIAYFAPHAPHLPASPAPWYINASVPNHAPRPSNYNIGWEDKHFQINNGIDKPMSQALINGSDNLHASRLRALMSVDDAIREFIAVLEKNGAIDSTYIIATSDHGYRLGQWGLWCEKASPYETDARVPLSIRGPLVSPGSNITALVSMNVDIGATILDLAGIPDQWPSGNIKRDGKSLVPILAGGPSPNNWRDRVIVEFVGWQEQEWLSPCQFGLTEPNFIDCSGSTQPAGLINSPSNRYTSIRVLNTTHNFLYAEWRTALSSLERINTNWTEAYDLRIDPGEITNLAVKGKISKDELEAWSNELWKVATCEGEDCP